MHWSDGFRAALLFSILFVPAAARGQSETDEIGPLPTALPVERLQSLPQLNPVTAPDRSQPRARRRLPKPLLLLSPEESSYRETVRTLGVNTHRFVHCDLLNGKVRTGVITEIRDDGFVFKDGIITYEWIPYTELKAAPRPVAAVGTRIGLGLKWAGVVAVCAAAAPVFIVLYVPLVWTGAMAD